MSHSLSEFVATHLAEHGIECEILTEKAEWRLRQTWRDHFMEGHDDGSGGRPIDGAEWFAASSRSAKTLRGPSAESAFNEANATHVILLSSNKHVVGLTCRAEKPITSSIIKEMVEKERGVLDLCICPTDFAWTMIFTHEPHLSSLFVQAG